MRIFGLKRVIPGRITGPGKDICILPGFNEKIEFSAVGPAAVFHVKIVIAFNVAVIQTNCSVNR
jgi:hypothetical protein